MQKNQKLENLRVKWLSQSTTPCKSDKSGKSGKKLDMDRMAGAFLGLLAGILLAIFVWVYEVIVRLKKFRVTKRKAIAREIQKQIKRALSTYNSTVPEEPIWSGSVCGDDNLEEERLPLPAPVYRAQEHYSTVIYKDTHQQNPPQATSSSSTSENDNNYFQDESTTPVVDMTTDDDLNKTPKRSLNSTIEFDYINDGHQKPVNYRQYQQSYEDDLNTLNKMVNGYSHSSRKKLYHDQSPRVVRMTPKAQTPRSDQIDPEFMNRKVTSL
ncbi:hypothetical protein Ciccas_008459 [Cichlidogyrus casuarinus]|uniref:Uncharacterized protein n=1 Tax=Cichlidogyrus casuarinus TaxID=1844966 RepID=A0ABD2Q0P7_9PLAT